MADATEVTPAIAAPAPVAAAPAAAPIESTVSSSTTPASTTTEAAVTPVAVAPSPESVVVAPATDLLGAEPKADEVKPAEGDKPAEVKAEEKPAEKTEEVKTEEAKPAEEVKPVEAALPVYEPFKLPDAFKENTDAAETVTKFAGILGKFETSPKTHEDFQKFGQEATDFYINGVQGALTKQQDYYVNLHQKNITDRIDAVRADPVLGGKNFEKTSADMIEAVQAYGGSKEQIIALRKDMQESGMGVAPSLVRLVANMKTALDKYTKEPVSSNVTGTKPQPAQKGLIQTLYNSN